MAIKNLLVAYGGSKSSDAALDFALYLRKRYKAHLTGLLAHYQEPVHQVTNSWIPEAVRENLKQAEEKANKEIAKKFKQRIKSNTAADNIHWISRKGFGDTTVAKYARYYDLTIIGRYDAVHGEAQQELHPDLIAMVSGRPVLLIPREFDTSSFNEHAVVAWDGKRASARALADAMPILLDMQMVTIVTVDDGRSEASLPEIDIETALRRHGVTTEWVNLDRGRKLVGTCILNFLKQTKANLLVMGAYEHSKFRQSIIGGVTSKVLKKAKVPVIISH